MSLEVGIHLWRDRNICSKYIHHLQIFLQPSLERILLVQYLIHFKSEVDMSQMSNSSFPVFSSNFSSNSCFPGCKQNL